jgi:hypothetical protein
MDQNTVIIPAYITHNAFYTIPLLLLNSFVAYVYELYILTFLLYFLFLTSLIYWYRAEYFSFLKLLDIIATVTNIVYITFYTDFNSYQNVWNYSIGPSILVFIINEILFYYQISRNSKYKTGKFQENWRDRNLSNSLMYECEFCGMMKLDKVKLVNYKPTFIQIGKKFFSLQYTYPNTFDRTCCYYRYTYIYLLFLHVLPTITCIYCIILSH